MSKFILLFQSILAAKFLHITDIHLDRHYKPGSTIRSSCHQVDSSGLFATKGDSAGKYGSPASGCDAPYVLVNKTFEFINTFLDDLDFVIWTGDNARHDSDPNIPREWEEIKSLNEELSQIFNNTFYGKKVLPSIGNNDIYPHNTLTYDHQGDNMILNTFSRLWADWIPRDQIQGFRIHGCFTQDLTRKIRGVSFNTIYLFNSNAYADECYLDTSPGHVVLNWLEKVLENAQDERMSVYISGHVPPNPGNFIGSCFNRFSEISIKYKDIIHGQFYGHMNLNHFYFPVEETFSMVLSKPQFLIPSWISVYFQHLLYHYKLFNKKLKTNSCLSPILVAPSVVPAFNPALRIFEYEQDGSLVGYKQYFANLTLWNSFSMDESNSSFYTLLYDPLESYGMKSLTGCDYKDLAKRLVKSTEYDILVDATHDNYGKRKGKSGKLVKTYLSNMMVGIPY